MGQSRRLLHITVMRNAQLRCSKGAPEALRSMRSLAMPKVVFFLCCAANTVSQVLARQQCCPAGPERDTVLETRSYRGCEAASHARRCQSDLSKQS